MAATAIGSGHTTSTSTASASKVGGVERCAWVPFADPLYVAYHDEEWGVPVRDDRRTSVTSSIGLHMQ